MNKEEMMKGMWVGIIVILVVIISGCEPVEDEGEIIDEPTTERQEVYQDAVKVRNASALYCAQPDSNCSENDEITFAMITDYIDVLDTTTVYDLSATNNVVAIVQAGNEYYVTLERFGTGDYEFPFDRDPINYDYNATVIDSN